MQLVDATDALGGTGSIPTNLRDIATNGLSRFIDGYLSRKYPLTSFNEAQAVDSYGNPVTKGAPQTPVSPVNTLSGILSMPIVWGVGFAVLATLGLIIVARKV